MACWRASGSSQPFVSASSPSSRKRAATLTSQSERARLYRQAEQMIHDDVARIFVANAEPPLAFSKRVKGFVANPTATEFFNVVELQ